MRLALLLPLLFAASCASESQRVVTTASEPVHVQVVDAAIGTTSGVDDFEGPSESDPAWIVLVNNLHEPSPRVFRLVDIGLCDIFKQMRTGDNFAILRSDRGITFEGPW